MQAQEFPVVHIENGPVKGIKTKSVMGTDYLSFRGIPYMRAPLGKLRFRDALSPQNWTETFDATEEGPSYCMTDFLTLKQVGQENAGTINVFTKNLTPQKLYPVMIWIHGGGYMSGSSQTHLYGPDYLLEKDVIVVSFNYRLGAIGFLSLDDPSLGIPGNQGLKDQVFALQWIQKNIEKFGGDRKRCTIFGESAGGSSVHYLTIAKQTKGLFQRAILMSGSTFNKTWSLNAQRNQGEQLARALGWKGKSGNEREILEFLEDVSAFELDSASRKLLTNEQQFGYGRILAFGPVVEPYLSENCLLPKQPIEMASETWSNEIDFIVTGTSFEGLLRAFIEEEKAVEILQNASYFAPLTELSLGPSDEISEAFGERIKKLYYTKGEKVALENQEQYLRFNSDLHFWHGLYRVILSRNAHATGKTYLFYFDVDAELNLFKAMKKCQNFKGACHADDLFYLFHTAYHQPPPSESKEFATIQKMVGMFTSFAINGSPNCPELPDLFIKPQDGSTPMKCINITENAVIESSLPCEENLKVWNSIYDEHDVPLY